MADPTDWNEPAMAAYLREHIFNVEGPRIRAMWACGFGCVPLGFTTDAPNCIERCHRTVKGLLPGNHWDRDLATTMVRVCDAVDTKIASGHYRGLGEHISEPPPGLFNWRRAKRAKLGEWQIDSEDEGELGAKQRSAPRRLDVTSTSTAPKEPIW